MNAQYNPFSTQRISSSRRRAAWILLLAVAGWLLLAPGVAEASKEIAEKTELACTACHDKPGSKLLTDQGKYYEVVGSLEGYETVMQVFGSCTHCHVRKPGSQKLTPAGRKFSEMMEGMAAFQDWVRAVHPVLASEASPAEPDADADADGEEAKEAAEAEDEGSEEESDHDG
ncbi:MAG: hypothetical protein SX243_03935 [Acidobacteriota bacterium]|nr:hypothetical protein [Acidobacteriota bacterium]